jgi:putative tricarboxylic transport membrane protein
MERKLISPNRFAGILSIGIGSLSIFEGTKLYSMRMSIMVGDHTFPILIGAILVILGLTFLFNSQGVEFFIAKLPSKQVKKTIYLSIITMFIYLFLIPILGYLISTFLAVTALFKIFGSFKWLKCLLMSSIFSICLYMIFILWLKMPFPSGIFVF